MERTYEKKRVIDRSGNRNFDSAVLQQWLDENKNLYTMLPYLRSYMGHVRFEDTAYYIHVLPDRLVKSPGINWEAIDKTGLEEALWEH